MYQGDCQNSLAQGKSMLEMTSQFLETYLTSTRLSQEAISTVYRASNTSPERDMSLNIFQIYFFRSRVSMPNLNDIDEKIHDH